MSEGRVLAWQPSAHARRVVTLVALALVLGLAIGRVSVIALAASPLAYLSSATRRRPPARIIAEASSSVDRCFERESVDLGIRIHLDAPADIVRIRLRPAQLVSVNPGTRTDVVIDSGADAELITSVRVLRWGRRSPATGSIDVYASGFLLHARTMVKVDKLAVLPRPARVDRLTLPVGRSRLVGDHRAPNSGVGVEFAGVRLLSPGDHLSRINWRVSSRLDRLHVTEAAAEHAVDVVTVVDTFDEVGPVGRSTLDLSLRGAAGLAEFVLLSHDRVGVIALGGRLQWLRADIGRQQLYRVAEAMLDVARTESYVTPNLRQLPRAALPTGCVVILFSPLLDARALRAIQVLRARGHLVNVVDVLTSEPVAELPTDKVALRLWRLDRVATVAELASWGVAVTSWDGQQPLGAALAPALRTWRRRR